MTRPLPPPPRANIRFCILIDSSQPCFAKITRLHNGFTTTNPGSTFPGCFSFVKMARFAGVYIAHQRPGMGHLIRLREHFFAIRTSSTSRFKIMTKWWAAEIVSGSPVGLFDRAHVYTDRFHFYFNCFIFCTAFNRRIKICMSEFNIYRSKVGRLRLEYDEINEISTKFSFRLNVIVLLNYKAKGCVVAR